MQLRPEVAALFELTNGSTLLYVVRLERTVDLTKISVEQAEQLLALPGGFEWLRRKQVPENSAGLAAVTTRPARAKKKKASQ
jgi:hypothetical protein